MPLFACAKCNALENTALSNYWINQRDGKPLVCSACDPEIAEWHSEWVKCSAAGYGIGDDGFIYSPAEVASRDYPKRVRIVGTVAADPDPGSRTQ
jgi:hypothetical protein